MMDTTVTFPGGKRVSALIDGRLIETDQPAEMGGQGSAPAPFDLFLAASATCAGIYVLGFLQARGLSTEGLELRQTVTTDPTTHLPTTIRIAVKFPPDLPEKYHAAILRAAESCKVKKTIAAQPVFEIVRDVEVATPPRPSDSQANGLALSAPNP